MSMAKGDRLGGVKTLVGAASAGILIVGLMTFAAPVGAQSDIDELGAGSFLVASRSLLDPNFDQTVVLLLDYQSEGALGVIVNRPTQVGLGEMVTDMESLVKRSEKVWVGGPVAHWQVVLLVRSADDIEDAERVFEDVHFTASRIVLERLLASDTEFRAYAGYAGWAGGQLEDEIDRGSWHVLPGDPDLVFDPKPFELWRELITRGEAQWAWMR